MTAVEGEAVTSPAAGAAPPAEQQVAPSSTKRRADRQITKDDKEGDDDDGEAPSSGGFHRASAETMKARRIVKVKRVATSDPVETKKDESKKPDSTAESSSSNSSSINPYAAVASSLASTKKSPGFGAGFSGFGSLGGTKSTFGAGFASSGFGAAAASSTTPSEGFGIKASSSGATSIFGDGVTKFGETSSEATVPKIALQDEETVTNGEEGEACIFELRVKTYLWGKVEEKKQVVSKETTMSVPPSSATAPTTISTTTATSTKEKTEEKEEEKETESDKTEDNKKEEEGESAAAEDTKTDEKKEETSSQAASGEATSESKEGWRELGIGPLKILKNGQKKVRLVHRREAGDGGKGTKLLLNVPLHKESKITRATEKSLKFTTLGKDGTILQYFIKSKEDESGKLQKVLESEITAAATLVK